MKEEENLISKDYLILNNQSDLKMSGEKLSSQLHPSKNQKLKNLRKNQVDYVIILV